MAGGISNARLTGGAPAQRVDGDRVRPMVGDVTTNDTNHTKEAAAVPFSPAPQLSEGELVGLFLAERLLQQYRGTYCEIQLEHAFFSIWGEGLSDFGFLQPGPPLLTWVPRRYDEIMGGSQLATQKCPPQET